MPRGIRASSSSRRFAGIALIVASSVAIAVYGWFAASILIPLVHAERPVEYLFLGAPLVLPLGLLFPSLVILVAVHTRWVVPFHSDPWSVAALRYLAPLLLLLLAPVAALALIPKITGGLPVLLYVLVDLRPWWTVAIALAVFLRFDTLRGAPVRTAVVRRVDRLSPHARTLLLEAALLLGLMAWAIVSTPYLRFTSLLHGDEPKYIRYCESFYQGLGVEVGRQQEFDALTLAYSPRVWRNVVHLARAIPAEAGNLVDDFRTLVRDPGFRFNRGRYTDAWFFFGKDGGFYQVHNPGLSALLFPAYFLDRHFISTTAGYQGVFAGEMPATNLALLLIWAVWGVVVFRLLLASTGRVALSWCLGAAAMLSMPVAAFPFQIYPETSGGLIVTALALWLLFGRPEDRPPAVAAAAGAAAAFLPWLHIRMLVLSVVLFGWAMFALGRRRLPFAALFVVVIGALCLYSYHLTGSLRPDSMYATEGTPSPWTLRFALQSAAATPFDRIWGFFPHAPIYLLSIAGWVPMFRAQPRVAALLLLLIAALVVPTAGHGFSAAGATPLRQDVAVIPLMMVAVSWTVITWGTRRWMKIAFALLLVLSLDASWSYNRVHIKETGRMIDTAISGWTPNLLFPWVHATPWAEWRGTFVLFLLWASAAGLMLLASIVLRPRAGTDERVSTRHVLVGMLLFVLLGTGATALGGEWTRRDYFLPLAGARERAAGYLARTERCRICYSSLRGGIRRTEVLADTNASFEFGAEQKHVVLGEPVRLVATIAVADELGWGSVSVDFGDGQTTRVDVFGRAIVSHTYRAPGIYNAVARFPGTGRSPQQYSVSVSVRPTSLVLAEVEGLPDAVKSAPERGAIGRVLLGPDGLTSSGGAGTMWLIAWNGVGWLARPADAIAEIEPGTWVALVHATDSARSAPLFVHWPHPAVRLAAPAVLNP